MTPEQRARLEALPVANIGDAMDRLYMMHSAIKPVWKGAKVVGTAYTVFTAQGDNKEVHVALDAASEGDVIVVAAGGNTERAIMGELMAGRAKANGLAGIIIDGAIRDAEDIGEIGLPVFAAATTPAGPYRNGPGLSQVPVAAAGVPVLPGDIIVGDSDGVIAIPAARLEEVLQGAEAKFAKETAQRAAIGLGDAK